MTVTVGANGEGSEMVSLEPGAYTVTENDKDGYTLLTDNRVSVEITAGKAQAVSFTNTVSDVSVTATKVWKDGLGANRPESVSVLLYRNGEVYGEPAKLSKDGGWRHTWGNLPKYDATGGEYTYTVKEVGEDGGSVTINGVVYDVTYGEDNAITNTIHDDEDVTVIGTKTWVDGGKTHSNEEEITLTLYRQSAKSGSAKEEVKNATLTWDGDTYTFSDLDRYDKDGYAYTYSVEEAGVVDGQITINGVVYDVTYGENNAIINTIHDDEQYEISGTKTWVDGGKTHSNKDEIELTLYRQSAKPASAKEEVKNATLTWDGNKYTFSDLEKYDGEGYAYTYSVEEANVENGQITINDVVYDVTYGANNAIINTIHDDAQYEISGTKTWVDGGKPHSNEEEITLTLYRQSATVAKEAVDATLTWDGNTYTFSGLEKYDGEGYAYTYSVEEAGVVDGQITINDVVYDVTYGANNAIINTIHDDKDVTVIGTKTWVDGGKTHSNEEEITLTLYRQSAKSGSAKEEVKNATLAWDGNKYTFSDLDRYDEDGYEYTYTVEEVPIAGYETTYEGNNITNTAETATVTVTKVWEDQNDAYGLRPDSVVVTLTGTVEGETEPVATYAVTLSADEWTATQAVRTHDGKGNPITYAVSEAVPSGYTAKYSDPIVPAEGGSALTVTNTLDTVDVTIQKIVSGSETERTFTIGYEIALDDAEVSGTAELANKETKIITVPKGATVTVSENEPGWEATISDNNGEAFSENGTITVTNERTTVSQLSVEKVWQVPEGMEMLTPALNVTITRHVEGGEPETVDDTVELTATNGWTAILKGSFETHDENGNPYIYTATEKALNSEQQDALDAYTFSVTPVMPAEGETEIVLTNAVTDDDTVTVIITKNVDGPDGGRMFDISYTVAMGGAEISRGTAELKNGASETITVPKGATVTVSEDPGEGWEVSYQCGTESGVYESSTGTETFDANGEIVVWNTRELLNGDGELTVKKVWEDDGNAFARPEVYFDLYGMVGTSDGERYLTLNGSQEVLSAEKAAYAALPLGEAESVTFTRLPARTANGQEIDWIVEERMEGAKGYTWTSERSGDAENGFTFTNTLKLMNVVVDKTWQLNGIELSEYPTVEVELSVGATSVGTETFAQDDEGRWTATFEDVPYRERGYTVKETSITGGKVEAVNAPDTAAELFKVKTSAKVGAPTTEDGVHYTATASLVNKAYGEIARSLAR